MAGAGAAGAEASRQAGDRFADAHRALVADPDVQFSLSAAPPPAQPPQWLKAVGDWILWALRPIGRALAWLFSWLPDWPYARILLWGVIALLLATIAWMAVERIRHGEWRLPRWRRRRHVTDALPDDEPLFDAEPARAWLREADALAAVGRFAEAAHLLLLRSVEDLARRRPGAVKPALTARELAAATIFPAPVRERFAAIALLVERSLFGGRPVDADDWQTARARYAELALPRAWRE